MINKKSFGFISICSIVLFLLAVLEFLSSVIIKGKNYMAPIVMIVSIILMLGALLYVLFIKKHKTIFDFFILVPFVVWISSLILIIGYTLFEFSSPYQTYNVNYLFPCFVKVNQYKLLEINQPVYDDLIGSRIVLNLNLIVSFLMTVSFGWLWLLEYTGKINLEVKQDYKKENYFVLFMISISLLGLSSTEYFTRLFPAQGRIYLLIYSILVILALSSCFLYFMFFDKNRSSIFVILLLPIMVWILFVSQMYTTEPLVSVLDSEIPNDYQSYLKFPNLLMTEFYIGQEKHSQFGVPVFTFITSFLMTITFGGLSLKTKKLK
jgi:hypothetical protein